MTVNQPKGTHLKMRMGELLREDGSIEYNTTGVFATGVVQTDEYICARKRS
ncbi:MAG: family 78 glycoside hydrolase catalytic domain [Parabacteroides sp.]